MYAFDYFVHMVVEMWTFSLFLWSHARRDIEIKKKTFELEQYETTKLDTPCHYPFGSIFFFWSLVSRSELDLDVDSHSVGKKNSKAFRISKGLQDEDLLFLQLEIHRLVEKKICVE